MNALEICFKKFYEYMHSRSNEKKFVLNILNDEEIVFLENLAKELGINLAEKNAQGETALHYAAYYGQIAAIHYLIEKYKLNIFEKDSHGATALHFAASGGQIILFDHLIDKYQFNPAERDNFGGLAIHAAAEKGQIAIIDHLVSKYKFNPAERDINGGTALHIAAGSGQIATIDHLVSKYKFNPAERDTNGGTALHIAAGSGQITTIDHLVNKYQLNLAERDNFNGTAMHYAVEEGQIATIDHLVNKYQLNPAERDNNGRASIHTAAAKGQIATINHLVSKYQLNPAERDKFGGTALHLAAGKGQIATFDHLVSQHQLNPGERDNDGRTAMHLTAGKGQIATFDHLVNKYQLNPAEKDNFGGTALHLAAGNGQIAFFDHLLSKYQLNPAERDNNGGTAIHYAALFAKIALIEHLVREYKLNPFEKDNNGQAALHYAEVMNVNYVDALLKRYSFDLQEFIDKNPNCDKEIKKRLETAITLFTKIKISDFNEVKTILEKMMPEEKLMILNWDEAKKLLVNCILSENVDLLTLLIMHGANLEEFEIEESERNRIKSIQDCMAHATVRSNYQNGGLNQNPRLLKRVVLGSQQEGPYQATDRQILGESLLAFNIVADQNDLNAIKINNVEIKNLSQAELAATRRLCINLLSENVKYFPGNRSLIDRELQSFGGLNNGMGNMFNNNLTPLDGALAIIENLKKELEGTNQRLRNRRPPLFSAYQIDSNNQKRKGDFDMEQKQVKHRKYFRS